MEKKISGNAMMGKGNNGKITDGRGGEERQGDGKRNKC